MNSGAIMTCSLVGRSSSPADKFDKVLQTWKRLAGGLHIGFDNSTFLSERRTADRNNALAYFMREKQAFPSGTDIHEVLDFYFQCCSIQATCESMSVVASTLANGGVCPLTSDRVFDSDSVRNRCVLTMLVSRVMADSVWQSGSHVLLWHV